MIDEPPWTTVSARALTVSARSVPITSIAEMIEEPPVLGREHRLDQIWRQFVERDLSSCRMPRRPDLLAIAVEKGYREIGFLEPVVGGFLKGRTSERERQQAEANASVSVSQASSLRTRRQPERWNPSMKAAKEA